MENRQESNDKLFFFVGLRLTSGTILKTDVFRIVSYLRKIIPIFKLFFENINSRYTLKDLLILFSIIVKNFIGYALFIYVKDLIDIRYFNE